MKTINMGNSGLLASAVGLGCMRIAGMHDAEVQALVEAALAAGIDLFDHADIYGGGESERIFGRLLKAAPSLRDSVVLQSKCGIRDGWYDLSKEHILAATNGILGRLNTDYLDLLILHRPDALLEPEEIAEAFSALQRSGKVRYFGVSNMNPAQMALIGAGISQKLIVNQLQLSAARSGIIDAGINVNVPDETGSSRDGSVLEYCQAERVTVQTWSSLQYGWFEGTFLNHVRYPALNAVLDRLAEKYSCTSGAVAIAWILRHPAQMQAIVGSTSGKRITEMAQAADFALERQEWYEIYKAAGNQLP